MQGGVLELGDEFAVTVNSFLMFVNICVSVGGACFFMTICLWIMMESIRSITKWFFR